MTADVRWGRIVAVVLALATVAPGALLRRAEARPMEVMVTCPTEHRSMQVFPRDVTYSGGRMELQWRVLVNQPVNYRLWVTSPVRFEANLQSERAGQFYPLGTIRPNWDGGRGQWVAGPINHRGQATGDPSLWVITVPQANPAAGFSSFLVLVCDGPPSPSGGGYKYPLCHWENAPGVYGQGGARRCVCPSGPVPDTYCADQP